MPVHSSWTAFPLGSVPSIVTFVRNGKAISYFTVLLRPAPRARCDFFAFNFHVPSNELPKQTAPAASQTATETQVALHLLAQMKPGFGRAVHAFFECLSNSGQQEFNTEISSDHAFLSDH